MSTPRGCMISSLQEPSKLFRPEPSWAGFSLKGHLSRGVDHIVTLGPRSVASLDVIVHLVDHRWDLQIELFDHRVCDLHAIFIRPRLGVDNALSLVDWHLPLVFGMRLFNVDDQEFGLVFEILVKLFEGGDRRAERRSRVASENQDDFPIPLER